MVFSGAEAGAGATGGATGVGGVAILIVFSNASEAPGGLGASGIGAMGALGGAIGAGALGATGAGAAGAFAIKGAGAFVPESERGGKVIFKVSDFTGVPGGPSLTPGVGAFPEGGGGTGVGLSDMLFSYGIFTIPATQKSQLQHFNLK